MNNFKAVYQILTALEACMDLESANQEMFSSEMLEVSKERWNKYIEMMLDCGYIKGVKINRYLSGTLIDCTDIQITLKGLEYLQENSIMQRIFRTAKGIKESFSGL